MRMKHFIGVAVLVVILTALVGLALNTLGLLPDVASLQGQYIDGLFQVHTWIIAFLFALIVGFMLYSIIVFRRKEGDESDAEHIEGNNALEITWTVVPLITVLSVAVLGANTLSKVTAVDPGAMEVKVIGQQWAWRFEYPEAGVVSDVLYLPKGQQALLEMESMDVLHSFWVPEFRVKQDLMPGSTTELRITPTEIGDYTVRCAEVCGLQHTYMLADVKVVSEGDFNTWLSAEAAIADDPVARGQKVYESYGCKACHTIDGSPLVGPSFLGAFGRTVELADGTTVLADADYFYNSIINPTSQIVAGFPPAMPQNFADQLSDQQIKDVIDFIMSLSDK
ncbi:MAG TPA: cytochrome c oxidase subunit II [Chloroflexi bacterium]|nr:cytochrome c oxidase subunit II [Chloroflexota bacterium]